MYGQEGFVLALQHGTKGRVEFDAYVSTTCSNSGTKLLFENTDNTHTQTHRDLKRKLTGGGERGRERERE